MSLMDARFRLDCTFSPKMPGNDDVMRIGSDPDFQ
jgi:hypothetical protein